MGEGKARPGLGSRGGGRVAIFPIIEVVDPLAALGAAQEKAEGAAEEAAQTVEEAAQTVEAAADAVEEKIEG